MTNRICGLFGIEAPPVIQKSDLIVDDIRLGIEVEQEYGSQHIYNANISNSGLRRHRWNVTRDGSLRDHGIEFVSQILYPHEVRDSLNALVTPLSFGNFTWRCGIHVHVDVSFMNAEQLRKMAEAYAVMEHLIFAWEGNNREQSRFCVPWYSSPDGVQQMFRALSSEDPDEIVSSFERFGKYTSLNMLPIFRQGTVEFRHMETTNDVDKIITYVNFCLGIVQAGRQLLDIPALLSSCNTATEVIKYVFGDHCDSLTNVPGAYDLLWRGVDVSNMISLSSLSVGAEDTQFNSDVKAMLNWANRINKGVRK